MINNRLNKPDNDLNKRGRININGVIGSNYYWLIGRSLAPVLLVDFLHMTALDTKKIHPVNGLALLLDFMLWQFPTMNRSQRQMRDRWR